MGNVRGARPRMPMMQQNGGQQRIVKRSNEQMQQVMQAAAAKRKKMDVLVPDKNDDPDCQVVCTQPKNTGLPQIQSVQVSCNRSIILGLLSIVCSFVMCHMHDCVHHI